MVYSESGTAAEVAGMSRSAYGARAFVMRIVYDVLEQQAVPPAPGSHKKNYFEPANSQRNLHTLECKRVVANPMALVVPAGMKPTCVVFGSTVTALCNSNAMCMLNGGDPGLMLEAIIPQCCSFSGTLSTSNIIMANWSRDMWHSVANRVAR
ncbi:hypothetical protein KIN20_029853 [Parelaphostrongylus tenuis]|uniref:Uncharacterized protein n=1 Tax=Parelaphostrongylus tenuis TaxID=148309 RepID=A0AAD5R2X9_PARTN|nr:hypothetical protein KIN20_029853 [Parelaphostrongylus tenuis]